MAFSNNRSFGTLARNSTPDSKSNGNSLNVDYGIGSSAWGPKSVWGNGGFGKNVGSSATTREHSRDGLKQATQNENNNTGLRSTTLVGMDDQWFQPWKSSAGRTTSQIESTDGQAPNQQRSASHATVPSFSSAIASSRPPAISLNTSTTMAPSTHRHGTSGTMASRGYEAAPTVYTKHDRQQDPNSKYGRDSAAGGPWNVSPTDTRRPFPPSSRTVSQPMSRNNSQQQTVAGDERPMFTRPDYGHGQQRQAQSSFHTPSASSHSNHPFHQLGDHMDQLPLQFGQLSMNGDSRPQTSYRASDATFSNPMSAGISPLTRSSMSGPRGSVGFDEADDFEGDNHQYSDFSNTLSPLTTNFSAQTYGGRLPPTPIAADFRPSQPFTNGQISIPTGPKGTPDWQAMSSGMNALQLSRSSFNAMDQQAIMTPQMQQLLAAQVKAQYGTIFNPYAMPAAIPINGMNPYLPIIPMSFPQVDPTTPVQEMPPGENLQSALLFEFKSNAKSKRYELRDIYEHIAEFSGDQHGSRFIQTKLETANSDEKNRVFEEIAPNAIQLMTDVFGNYVIQKFFEHGDQTHKKILAAKMKGQVLALSNQMYGCRVVQKALDHVLVDQQAQLIRELDGHVLKCVKDQNGNHVIQKAIERCPAHIIGFVIDAFRGSVQQLSVNSYGCRVIQRCLEHCDGPAKALIMSELMDGIQGMITDQYGNYVVQHVVERDDGEGRRNVLNIVMKSLELYSKHKFASNVVEKCLQCSDDFWRRGVLEKLASEERRGAEGESVLVGMIKDNYGNYVIQKLLDTIHQQDYFLFLEHLQPAVACAKRSGCGKQIQSVERKMERFSRGGVRQPHVPQPPPAPANMMPQHPLQLTGPGADFRSGHVKQMPPGGAWNAFHPNGLGFMGMGAGRGVAGGDAVEGAERR